MTSRLFLLALIWLQASTASGGVRVSGMVVPDPPRAGVPTYVFLIRGNTTLKTRTASDHTFMFPNVPPGTYDAYVDDVGMDRETMLGLGMAPTKVVVGPDGTTDVRLQTARRMVVKGSTLIDGTDLIPAYSLVYASTRAGARPITNGVGYAGAIYTQLFAGDYRVTVAGLPAGYRLRSLKAGTIDLLSQVLTVGSGAPTLTVGIALDPSAPSPFVMVSGRLTGGTTSTYRQTQIGLSSRVLAGRLSASVAEDGSFVFPRVLPGTYGIHYMGNRPLTGEPAISLGIGTSDLTGVELPLTKWKEISGRVVVPPGVPFPQDIAFWATFPNGADLAANGAAVADPGELPPGQVVVTPLGPLLAGAQVGRDGRFVVTLPTGERQFRLPESSVPPGTMLKSARFGDADLLNGPMRVTAGGVEELVLTFVARGLAVR